MKSIAKVILLLFVLTTSPLFAQTDLSFGYQKFEQDIITFVEKVNGSGSLTAAVQSADGSYLAVSKIGKSFLARKINASGQKEWERMLHSKANPDVANIDGIAQTTDGGFVLAGRVGCDDPFNLDHDCSGVPLISATLIKLRPNGTMAWKKNLSVTGEVFSSFASVIAMPDGGVIAIGSVVHFLNVTSRFLVVRFTAAGDVVWQKSFESFPDSDVFYNHPPKVTANDGVILAFTNGSNPIGVDLMKISNSGNVVWKKSLMADDFVFQSVGTAAGNGVILIGTSRDSNKLKAIVLAANGTISWKAGYSLKVPGGIISVSSPIQTSDGGYILTGTTYDASARKFSGIVAKIDSSRRIAFQNTFGGNVAGAVFPTGDGGFFVLGSGTGLLVLKVNSEGIVPGCSFVQSLGSTPRGSFGPLKASTTSTISTDLSSATFGFGMTSVVTDHPESTLCQ